MKVIFVVFVSTLISISAMSQNDISYRRDDRPQSVREDSNNQYQSDRMSEIRLLKALEMAGIRIFDFPVSPAFEKEYKYLVSLTEYVGDKKIKSNNLFPPIVSKNIYRHSVKDTVTQEDIWYFDYIPRLTIYTKDNDSTAVLNVEHLAGAVRGMVLNKKKERDRQFYNWRSYSKTDWVLNEEVPLLVYASSYYDGKVERFCGEVDLSKDENSTKELLEKSPHYYVISIKVSE